MALPQLTRDQLMRVFITEANARAYEELQRSLANAPEALTQAAEDAAQALLDAAAAMAAAVVAQTSANAAQANVDAVEAVAFVTVGPSGATPNERALAVGQGLQLVDGGAGGNVTIGTTELIAVLPSDVSDVTGVFSDASGLALALAANTTYLVDGLLTFQSAAVTTGLALGFTLPAGAAISGMYQHNTTATALEGSYNIAAGAVKGNTSGVLVATENVPIQGRWLIKTGATAGNGQLQFRTEVAASSVTMKAGLSVLVARRIA